MIKAELPEDEDARLAALDDLQVLNTPPDPNIDQLVQLASEICQVPISLVTLIDRERQWFKAKVGIEAEGSPRDQAFCSHTILQPGPLIIPDTRLDPRFQNHPMVVGEDGIRFYAGVPLRTEAGHVLGSLCVADRQPRELNPFQLSSLQILANQVMQL
ncbi:MAG: GAF domain-containing protein, partial [Candidatus Sericytochromatia bacterium]